MLSSLVSALILFGAAFVLLGSVGLAKLPDFFTRLHAPTKASTLGVSAILLAAVVFFSAENQQLSLHELLIIVFLWLTAPISALIMATVAKHLRKAD
ncbi:MAG: Na+/H+ antiporter subunit G [Halothiobacillus sp. 24-54-40]|nr:Na+/H+ antiporter subunit G [Halothiobacillaceae bacterium]OYV47416.1 MAG: Na+/H+ antiporter subunit G [Halothiobacillus sp. 20-53-49]OYY41158.1 MAG: Na+/H+ antiporter subunit G [Halothiobacillus sp. 35-54-62]OYZ87511.1 MAG: Na+/H+ antiporter subunit G [Halothiobacillus sp. 24-54-40]OZA81082.1 MAG: Na+/H+ antiporter subunit G [Halothiobacillus sp. 39-53-45]